MKFAAKYILHYPPHFRHIATLRVQFTCNQYGEICG